MTQVEKTEKKALIVKTIERIRWELFALQDEIEQLNKRSEATSSRLSIELNRLNESIDDILKATVQTRRKKNVEQ